MRFYAREDQDKAAQELAATYREAAGIFPALRRVFEQYDSKVFNCKVTKALQEATGRYIYAEKRYSVLDFYFYERGRQFTLAQIRLDAMPDGKRIDAGKLIESARAEREIYLRKAAELSAIAGQVDTIKAQIEVLKKQLKAIVDPLPYEARDIWGLGYRITSY